MFHIHRHSAMKQNYDDVLISMLVTEKKSNHCSVQTIFFIAVNFEITLFISTDIETFYFFYVLAEFLLNPSLVIHVNNRAPKAPLKNCRNSRNIHFKDVTREKLSPYILSECPKVLSMGFKRECVLHALVHCGEIFQKATALERGLPGWS